MLEQHLVAGTAVRSDVPLRLARHPLPTQHRAARAQPFFVGKEETQAAVKIARRVATDRGDRGGLDPCPLHLHGIGRGLRLGVTPRLAITQFFSDVETTLPIGERRERTRVRTHPFHLTREALAELRQPPRVCVTEVPLLYESGGESRFDKVIVITAPRKLRESRTEMVLGADRERRLLPDAEKAKRADYVYVNTGDLDELDEFVAGVMRELDGA